MKKTLSILAAAFAFVAASFAQTPAQTEGLVWTKKSHDFGTVKMGPKAEVTFEFTNKTNGPIVITAAQPSCSCTVGDYTKTPIMPGQNGKVIASYGTDGRPGFFQKSVHVTFDNGSSTDLIISGTVSAEVSPTGGSTLK